MFSRLSTRVHQKSLLILNPVVISFIRKAQSQSNFQKMYNGVKFRTIVKGKLKNVN